MKTKEKIGTGVGGIVGATSGTGGSLLAISAAGSVPGLGAAGITSGLAAIGGSMVGGLIVCTGGTAVVTVGACYLGYKLVKELF